MNLRNEEKVLKEFIKIIDDPERVEKKFIRYAKFAMFISMLFVFFCLSNNFVSIENKYYLALFAFMSGTAFGLGIWFLQAGTQTKILVKHMSEDSIHKRINEINS